MPTLSDGSRLGIMSKLQYQDRGSPPQVSHTNVFQHQTPSASSPFYSSPSASSNRFQESGASSAYARKRPHSVYNADPAFTPSKLKDWQSYKQSRPTEMMGRSGDIDSPLPFVNTRYELAGGMDSREDEYDYNYDLGRRDESRKLGRQDDGYSGSSRLPNLPTDANGRLRSPTQPKTDGVVGNVISKVWDFCTSAFRGFTAGGGQMYPIKSEAGTLRSQDEKTYTEYLRTQNLTPIPGRFPDEDFEEEYFATPSQNQTSPRPAKRRQISNGKGAERWVLVPETAGQSPQKSPRKHSGIPRPVSRGSVARRALLTNRTSYISHAGSPALQANRPASYASPRSPPSKPRDSTAPSPASIEARKFLAKKRKEEQEADESIRRFNDKLKAMIKEGQEALGTKIEIEDDCFEDHDMDNEMDDEGFVSGEGGW